MATVMSRRRVLKQCQVKQIFRCPQGRSRTPRPLPTSAIFFSRIFLAYSATLLDAMRAFFLPLRGSYSGGFELCLAPRNSTAPTYPYPSKAVTSPLCGLGEGKQALLKGRAPLARHCDKRGAPALPWIA